MFRKKAEKIEFEKLFQRPKSSETQEFLKFRWKNEKDDACLLLLAGILGMYIWKL